MKWFRNWRERRYQRRLRAFRERCLQMALSTGVPYTEASSLANEFGAYCLSGLTRYHTMDGA